MRDRDPRTVRWMAWTILVCALGGGVVALFAQVPTATEADRAFAQLAISRDGTVVTVRAIATDNLQLCVEPRVGQFGSTKCFYVGAIRRGEVRAR